MKYLIKISLLSALFVPLYTFAALDDVKTLVRDIGGLVNTLIIIVAGIALLVFFWGLVKFIFKAGGEEGIKEGKNLMMWGIVALFVMVSVWGLVYFIQDQFGISRNSANPSIPRVNL